MPPKPYKREIISTENLRRLVAESGLTVKEIEKGVGMPDCTLDKSLAARAVGKSGYVRTFPEKWVQPTINFIKEKKAAIVEIKMEVREVLIDHKVDIVEPEGTTPDKERKLAWIKKLQEVKAGLI